MQPNDAPLPSRRDFLGSACFTSCGATCALAAIPAVTYLFPSEAGAATGPVQLKSSDLPEGSARIVSVGSKKVLVIRNGGKLTAVAARCTHLGCIVAWDPAAKKIRCNCHGGIFEPDGRRIEGPPPRDQAPFKIEESADRVLIG